MSKYYVRQVKNMLDDDYKWYAYKEGGFLDFYIDEMMRETRSDTKEECLEKLKIITTKYYV